MSFLRPREAGRQDSARRCSDDQVEKLMDRLSRPALQFVQDTGRYHAPDPTTVKAQDGLVTRFFNSLLSSLILTHLRNPGTNGIPPHRNCLVLWLDALSPGSGVYHGYPLYPEQDVRGLA